jgi:hypothetical protein
MATEFLFDTDSAFTRATKRGLPLKEMGITIYSFTFIELILDQYG